MQKYTVEATIDPFADPIDGHDGDLWRVDIFNEDGELLDCDQPYKTEAEAIASGEAQFNC